MEQEKNQSGERITWVHHNGKKILRVDYSDLKGDELLDPISRVWDFYQDETPGTVLSMAIFNNTFANDSVVNAFKELTKKTKSYDRKSANVGISGIKKLFVQAVSAFSGIELKVFQEENDALDWLATD